MGILKKIRKILLLPFRIMGYGEFGVHSDIVNPFLVSGRSHIFIGDRTIIRDYARIEAIDSYWFLDNDIASEKRQTQVFNPRLTIGNHVTIEQGVHITCSNNLTISDNVTISSYVYISDTSHSYSRIGLSVLDQPLNNSPVYIGECAFIGTGVKILPGVSIGAHSVIGANSVVTHSIPADCVAVGVPAVVIKRLDGEKQ